MEPTIYVAVICDYPEDTFPYFQHWVSSGYMHKCLRPGNIVCGILTNPGTEQESLLLTKDNPHNQQNWWINPDSYTIIGQL